MKESRVGSLAPLPPSAATLAPVSRAEQKKLERRTGSAEIHSGPVCQKVRGYVRHRRH